MSTEDDTLDLGEIDPGVMTHWQSRDGKTSYRRYDWEAVARMARAANGAWRLHSDLVAITTDTLHHMRRRVKALQPTITHTYEFARGAEAKDDLGITRFDCFIRYVPKGTEP